MNCKQYGILSILAFTALMLLCQVVVAQTPVALPNAPVQAPVGGGVIVRPLWTEIMITLIMFGGALFAVGRSSNRS